MGKITDIIAIIRTLWELLKLLGLGRTKFALAAKLTECKRVAASMTPPDCRQYEEEKYRD